MVPEKLPNLNKNTALYFDVAITLPLNEPILSMIIGTQLDIVDYEYILSYR